MTERERRQRRVDLSVVTVSALSLTGAWLVVASVDAGRRVATEEAPATAGEATASAADAAPRPERAHEPAAALGAPAPGLVPAPRPRRRVVVRRRSRTS